MDARPNLDGEITLTERVKEIYKGDFFKCATEFPGGSGAGANTYASSVKSELAAFFKQRVLDEHGISDEELTAITAEAKALEWDDKWARRNNVSKEDKQEAVEIAIDEFGPRAPEFLEFLRDNWL